MAELQREGTIQLIDIREDYEWDAGRIPGARHLDAGRVAAQAETIHRETPVVFYCRVGGRSAMAANAFRARRLRGVQHDRRLAGMGGAGAAARARRWVCGGSLILALLAPAAAEAAPALVKLGDFVEPVYATGAPGDPDRVFVVERAGRVKVGAPTRPAARRCGPRSRAWRSSAGRPRR